eukprot:1137294-Pelagomonas_calceolata.AAC.4
MGSRNCGSAKEARRTDSALCRITLQERKHGALGAIAEHQEARQAPITHVQFVFGAPAALHASLLSLLRIEHY